MSDAAKKKLHELVDALPDGETLAAVRYLEFLCAQGTDPYTDLDDQDELDEADREKLHSSIERGLEQMGAGQGRPADEVLAELRRHR